MRQHFRPNTYHNRKPLLALALLLLCAGLICPAGASTGLASHWEVQIFAADGFASAGIGASPGWQDGYDGQTPYDPTGGIGPAVQQYRTHGDSWTGLTGWYWVDFESPIAPGGTKTWSDIYLWSQNYTPSGNQTRVGVASDIYPAPVGYIGHLVLDYVPSYLNWTGPTEFDIDLHAGESIILPVPTVTDPLDGVRMHITVTAPIPEPSALAALGFSLLPLGGFAIRRRRSRRG